MCSLKSTYYYPNRMGRIILLAMEEIIGREGVNTVLKSASLPSLVDNYPPDNQERQFSFDMVSRIQSTLEQAYGQLGGHGVALSTGRACFKYGLREFGFCIGSTEAAFKLLPLSQKLQIGGMALADVFNRYSDQQVRIDNDPEHIYWYTERCPICWKRQANEPICYLAVGFLHESLYWVSGGKQFNVVETQCIARGDHTCTIMIDKTPMD